jgi:hypothetical protein
MPVVCDGEAMCVTSETEEITGQDKPTRPSGAEAMCVPVQEIGRLYAQRYILMSSSSADSSSAKPGYVCVQRTMHEAA